MISVEEALQLLRNHLPDFGDSYVSSDSLFSGILAEDIHADRAYPPFHRVMMDGIAVNFNVWKEGLREFRIAGVSPAGEPAKTLTDLSSAFEVMTGAPLPVGTDLVIPYEHLSIENGTARITEEQNRSPMDNVHLFGSDTKENDLVLPKGSEFNGPAWGIAASVGKSKIRIKKLPRVNIISTGDELVEIEKSPLPHQIRRSNAYALKASLLQHGYRDIELSHLSDNEEAIQNHFRSAIKSFDLLIYSGGVSKGKFDYLPKVWKESGVKEIFHGITQRPGKPMWFGVHEESTTVVMGLPGNPVSSLVCLHRYLLGQRPLYAVLTKEIKFKNNLTYFVPAKLESNNDGKLLAHPLPVQNSGEFTGLSGSDGFIELPKEKALFSPGEIFLFHPWRKI